MLALVCRDAPGRAAAAKRSEPPKDEPVACRRLPPGQRKLKLNLKPDTEIRDLVSWIAAITCRSFILPGTTPVDGKRVTVVSPGLITVEEAYHLFVQALDSVGLAVYPTGPFFRIIEAKKAGSSPVPFDDRIGSL